MQIECRHLQACVIPSHPSSTTTTTVNSVMKEEGQALPPPSRFQS